MLTKIVILAGLFSSVLKADPVYNVGPAWEEYTFSGTDLETDFGIYLEEPGTLYISESVGDVYQPQGCLVKGPYLDFFGKGELQVSLDLEAQASAGSRKRPKTKHTLVGTMFATVQIVQGDQILDSENLYYQWGSGAALKEKYTSTGRALYIPFDIPFLTWRGSEPRNLEIKVCNVRFVPYRTTRESRWRISLKQAKFRWNIID